MKPLATAAIALAWIACATLAAETARNDGRDWPTLHGELQRSGGYPEFPVGSQVLCLEGQE
jgi:hypothetical protein